MKKSRMQLLLLIRLGALHSKNIGILYLPANPIWSEKKHEDNRFPFLKIHSSSVFFLALQVSHRIEWGSKFPNAFSLLKRLTIALKTHLSNENLPLQRRKYCGCCLLHR